MNPDRGIVVAMNTVGSDIRQFLWRGRQRETDTPAALVRHQLAAMRSTWAREINPTPDPDPIVE